MNLYESHLQHNTRLVCFVLFLCSDTNSILFDDLWVCWSESRTIRSSLRYFPTTPRTLSMSSVCWAARVREQRWGVTLINTHHRSTRRDTVYPLKQWKNMSDSPFCIVDLPCWPSFPQETLKCCSGESFSSLFFFENVVGSWGRKRIERNILYFCLPVFRIPHHWVILTVCHTNTVFDVKRTPAFWIVSPFNSLS